MVHCYAFLIAIVVDLRAPSIKLVRLPEVLQLNGICSSFPNYRGVVTKVDVGWALVFEADCHLYA